MIDTKPGIRQEIADALLHAVEKDEWWPAKAGKIRRKRDGLVQIAMANVLEWVCTR